MRVQIPAYTDHWMRGDRYGDVVSTFTIRLAPGKLCERARVKLDKSGKTATFNMRDCEVIPCAVCGRDEPEGDCCLEAGK